MKTHKACMTTIMAYRYRLLHDDGRTRHPPRALIEPCPRPGDVGLLEGGRDRDEEGGRAASDPLMSMGEVAGRLWEERGMSA